MTCLAAFYSCTSSGLWRELKQYIRTLGGNVKVLGHSNLARIKFYFFPISEGLSDIEK